MDYRLIYSGFDGLDVTFQGRIPRQMQERLEAAKEQAAEQRAGVRLDFCGVALTVAPTGAPGYRWRADTGPDGEIWFFQRTDDPQQWAIRVSVRAQGLALYGYAYCRDRLYERLDAWRATVLREAVSRADFAVDVLAPGFAPRADRIVAHYNSSIGAHAEGEEGEAEIYWCAGRVQSVRIGKLPGRQVAIYNKRRETLKSRIAKGFWWEIWDLDPDDPDAVVWRVEVRAGKDYLREFNIKTFRDLETRLADVYAHALRKIRLCADDQTDSNRSRWAAHELWDLAAGETASALDGWADGAVPGRIVEGTRAAIQSTLDGLVTGLLAPVAVAHGHDGPAAVEAHVAQLVKAYLRHPPPQYERALKRSRERYHFIERPTGESAHA